MHITPDEAVSMFARYCRARFGKKAVQKVRARAKSLKNRGDGPGYEIWNRVADEIQKNKSERPSH
jgi:hypothetical protein